MITRADIVVEARSWLDTRWRHQASKKGVGCDCIGFVGGVARELGIVGGEAFADDPEIRGYGREPNPTMLVTACKRYLDPVDIRALRFADVLVMRYSGQPRHFAIVSKRFPDNIIHAYAQARRVVENGLTYVWQSRIHSAWKFRGIDG